METQSETFESTKKVSDASKKKANVISLFDDDEEEEDNADNDIFVGLSTKKSR